MKKIIIFNICHCVKSGCRDYNSPSSQANPPIHLLSSTPWQIYDLPWNSRPSNQSARSKQHENNLTKFCSNIIILFNILGILQTNIFFQQNTVALIRSLHENGSLSETRRGWKFGLTPMRQPKFSASKSLTETIEKGDILLLWTVRWQINHQGVDESKRIGQLASDDGCHVVAWQQFFFSKYKMACVC